MLIIIFALTTVIFFIMWADATCKIEEWKEEGRNSQFMKMYLHRHKQSFINRLTDKLEIEAGDLGEARAFVYDLWKK